MPPKAWTCPPLMTTLPVPAASPSGALPLPMFSRLAPPWPGGPWPPGASAEMFHTPPETFTVPLPPERPISVKPVT